MWACTEAKWYKLITVPIFLNLAVYSIMLQCPMVIVYVAKVSNNEQYVKVIPVSRNLQTALNSGFSSTLTMC